MYKCVECGHLFEEGEQARWTEDAGECWGQKAYIEQAGCPICKGGYEEARQCVKCNGHFFKDELESGYCKECLESEITTDLAYKYFKEKDLVVDFLFNFIWDMDCPRYFTESFKNDCAELFLRKALDDKILSREYFLNLCKSYIMENADEFAKWLTKKEN